MNKIKEIKRKVRISKIKDLNNIPSAADDLCDAFIMLASDHKPSKEQSNKILRWKQNLPQKDNKSEDLSIVFDRMITLIEQIYKYDCDFEKKIEDLADTILIFSDIVKAEEIPEKAYTHNPDIELIKLNPNNSFEDEKENFYKFAIDLLKKSKQELYKGRIYNLAMYDLIYYSIVMQYIDELKYLYNKKAEE